MLNSRFSVNSSCFDVARFSKSIGDFFTAGIIFFLGERRLSFNHFLRETKIEFRVGSHDCFYLSRMISKKKRNATVPINGPKTLIHHRFNKSDSYHFSQRLISTDQSELVSIDRCRSFLSVKSSEFFVRMENLRQFSLNFIFLSNDVEFNFASNLFATVNVDTDSLEEKVFTRCSDKFVSENSDATKNLSERRKIENFNLHRLHFVSTLRSI